MYDSPHEIHETPTISTGQAGLEIARGRGRRVKKGKNRDKDYEGRAVRGSKFVESIEFVVRSL